MTDYRYVGVADSVSFSEEDFSRHEIKQGAVEFNADNDFTASLSKAAAEYLVTQGFQLLTKSDYDKLVHQRAQEAADGIPPGPVESELVVSEAMVAADAAKLDVAPSIPPRPGADADRDTLAAYAWTHYQIPVDTEEHNMTKAEINKALDAAEKAAEA